MGHGAAWQCVLYQIRSWHSCCCLQMLHAGLLLWFCSTQDEWRQQDIVKKLICDT
jgi:hypothetical protein